MRNGRKEDQMLKAGLIGAAVGFVLAIIGAVVFPLLCNPCAAVFVGLGAGILAGVYVRPPSSSSGAAEGAKAGAIATAGNLLGQMLGTVLNVVMVGPEAAADLAGQLGLPYTDFSSFAGGYYAAAFGGGCLCALLGVGLGAGLGAVGGLLWYQVKRERQRDEALLAGVEDEVPGENPRE
jgi:hypothetical protein